MQRPLPPIRIKSFTILILLLIALVAAGEEATSERIEAVQREAVVAEAGDQFRFNGAVPDVVETLVYTTERRVSDYTLQE
jgi:hypothetical protein